MTKRTDIIWIERVDSTNEEAKRRISDIDNLSVLSAFEQTAGRGQRGNTWSSKAGENLLFSIIVKFGQDGVEPLKAYDQFVISEIAALSVVDLLAINDIEARVKWPNDIYVGTEKICGILIENSLSGSELSHSIIGIGLNVNQTEFDPSLPNPTSMQKISGEEYDTHCLLEQFTDIFRDYLDRYCHIKGGYGRLRKLYLAQMWRKDEPSTFIDHTSEQPAEFNGTIRGLSDVGHMLIENEEGELREFAFKEISYIL
ncbi:MAG: biotin--[Bacteroidales bacterium]|nr:biotin--[acetyl-CoA-carboxylase] ligase [Bacteroidales bacterium]